MEWLCLATLMIAVFALCRTVRQPNSEVIHVHVWFTKDGEILEGDEWKHGLGDNSDE